MTDYQHAVAVHLLERLQLLLMAGDSPVRWAARQVVTLVEWFREE